tara:strand:+ start:811 stop:1407 length:597 start_codon:yes stop_codon:yes gene_type:complete
MIKLGKVIGAVVLISFTTYSQVGINTIDPQEALHVNGKVRVDDVTGNTSISVLGIDANGTLNTIDVGGSLEIHNNTIVGSGSGYYSVVDIPIITPIPNTSFNNLDLGLGSGNEYKTVIRFTGQTKSFNVTGIIGGIAGRHIILLNPTNVNMGLEDESNRSTSTNRIHTYGSGTESTSGQGAVELFYDGTRWILLNLRN